MLSLDSLQKWTTQWQTTLLNVTREYIQHVFLSYLYQSAGSEKLAFKGGTALRILYQSPRFSEDLDFTGSLKSYHLERLLSHTLNQIAFEGIALDTQEAKPTSGGYLALYGAEIYGQRVRLELNVSFRSSAITETLLVSTPIHPPYPCTALRQKELVGEKIQALLQRKKPRDFYDLYYLLRGRFGIEAIIPHKNALVQEVRRLDAKILQRELKLFLPVSHQRTIANLPEVLLNELQRL